LGNWTRGKVFDNYRGMPKEVTYLIYAAVLPSVAYGMFYTDISYFLTAVQGVSYDLMGIVVTAMGVSTFVASIFLGIAADMYGRKRLLIAGNLIASIILAVFALTTSSAVLLVAAVFEGISEAAVLVSSSALLAEKAENAKRNSAFSLYGFAQGIAFGFGSMIILAIAIFGLFGFTNKQSHVLLYVVTAVLSLASTFLILKVSESKRLKNPRAGVGEFLPKRSKVVLAQYILTGAIVAFGAGMVVPLMTAWFKLRFGTSDTVSGPILGISSILIGLATLAAPSLARRLGLVKAIVVTQAASTVFMFATPVSPDFASASFVYSMRALLMNMASPLSQSMIMGIVTEDERGVASGLSGALWRLPNALSTYVGAWLMGMGSLSEPFFLAGFFYMVSIALFWFYFRKAEIPEEQVY
jgi:MFS family permease